MSKLNRRDFLKLLGITATAGSLPVFYGCSSTSTSVFDKDFYKVPMKGNARILHITDVHGQLNPVYFREPNVNLGVGDAFGRPPHVVGPKFLEEMKFKPATAESLCVHLYGF